MKKRNSHPPAIAIPRMSRDALRRLDLAYDQLRKERAAEFFRTQNQLDTPRSA